MAYDSISRRSASHSTWCSRRAGRCSGAGPRRTSRSTASRSATCACSSCAVPAPEPQHLASEEEVFLAKLVQDLADGKRREDIANGDVLMRLDTLWKSGHERLAIEWMEKLLSVPGVPAAALAPLRAKLVERLDQRGELDTAVPHLEQRGTEETYALRAHYLLAEHARRREDHERARRHYEAVLGRDVDYPNVRVRVERLRQLTGRSPPAMSPACRPARATG